MAASLKDQIVTVVSDPQVNFLLERVLSAAGYTVTGVQDQASAERLLQNSCPALLMVGEQLPDGSGLSLAEKYIERCPNLPVLLLASQDNAALLKESLRTGVLDYLCLPLKTEQILQAVNTALLKAQRRKEWAVLESRRTTANLQRRIDELETLTHLGRTVTSTLDVDSVLSAVVDAAVELTGAEESSLLLLDEASGELYMRAARNFQEEFVHTFRIPVKDSLAGSVIRTGQPVILDEKTPQKIKTAYLVQGLLYVPLQIHGRIFGVLGVDNRQSRVPFSEHHVRIITALSDYAVVAIENARMYSHTAAERNKLESIVTQVQDGVIVVDNDERVVLLNQAVHTAYNLGESSQTGKPLAEVIQQPEILDLARGQEKRLSNHAELTVEDGRVFSALMTPIADVGRIITLHDITYLKKLDHIKSEFVTSVSHDLRSPLTAILGYIDLLERVGPLNEPQQDFVRRVQSSVSSITQLVDDLLNLGRIEAGFDTRKEEVALDHILQYSIDSLKVRIAGKNLQLLTEMPDQFPPVLGNPIHMRQMVDNLLDNAIKYTNPGGFININAVVEGSQLILQVSDSGIGIPPLDLPYIFDKFYRAGNAPGDSSGTGLGLAIVKSIVENHQGRIWVNSVAEQGTTFTIVLPITRKAG